MYKMVANIDEDVLQGFRENIKTPSVKIQHLIVGFQTDVLYNIELQQ
jgi:hypothetical protein